MELRHLEHFVAIAEETSFTQAARRLHLSQSARRVLSDADAARAAVGDVGSGLRGGGLDVAFAALPGEPAGLTLTPLAAEPIRLVCRPDHPLATRTSVTVGELNGAEFVDFPPGFGTRAHVDREFAVAGAGDQDGLAHLNVRALGQGQPGRRVADAMSVTARLSGPP